MSVFLPIIPTDGVKAWTDLSLGAIVSGGNQAKIHLFSNDYVPDADTVLANFTEAAAAGLAALPFPAPVSQSLWTDGREVWTFPQQVWTALGAGLPEIIYGYWVDCLDPITLAVAVLWAQRFQTPQALIAAGNTIKFTPTFGVKQC